MSKIRIKINAASPDFWKKMKPESTSPTKVIALRGKDKKQRANRGTHLKKSQFTSSRASTGTISWTTKGRKFYISSSKNKEVPKKQSKVNNLQTNQYEKNGCGGIAYKELEMWRVNLFKSCLYNFFKELIKSRSWRLLVLDILKVLDALECRWILRDVNGGEWMLRMCYRDCFFIDFDEVRSPLKIGDFHLKQAFAHVLCTGLADCLCCALCREAQPFHAVNFRRSHLLICLSDLHILYNVRKLSNHNE